jgi:hypothetical protein
MLGVKTRGYTTFARKSDPTEQQRLVGRHPTLPFGTSTGLSHSAYHWLGGSLDT